MNWCTTAATLLIVVLPAINGCDRGGTDSGPAMDEKTTDSRLESSPRHHEWAQIQTATGRTVRAYLVYPQVSKPVLAVVVIHENRGLSDWVRSVTDQVAEAGYVAVAPDMLS